MFTEGEIKYLDSIPLDKYIIVKPYNPEGLGIADRVMDKIKNVVPELEVVLIGSLALGIAGQEDIDINIFCLREEQFKFVDSIKALFGEPSRLGRNSTCWDFRNGDFDVSVWLTDPTVESTKRQLQVFNTLKSNPDLLYEYEKIKLEAKNVPYKEYQMRKYEFYHKILDR